MKPTSIDRFKVQLLASFDPSKDSLVTDSMLPLDLDWLPIGFPEKDSSGNRYKYVKQVVAAATGGTTITTSSYNSVALVAAQNLDDTNYVTAVYRTAGGGGTDQTHRILANRLLLVTDFTLASNLTLTANTAACSTRYFIIYS